MATKNLTAHLLRAHLSYNPETGDFVRLLNNGTAKAGDIAGWLEPNGYRKLSVLGAKYYAHRCAVLYMTGAWPAQDVDHIDGNKSNNRYSNLRCVSTKVNAQNLRSARVDNKTARLGVSFHRAAKKYMAEIKDLSGKRHYLGLYLSPDDAHAAYLTAKRKLHEGCTI